MFERIDFSEPNWKENYAKRNGLYCDICGELYDYNPYQDFWFESCYCHHSRNIFDLFEAIMRENQIYYIKKWLKQKRRYFGW